MKSQNDTLKTALTLQHQGTTLLHRINPKFFPVTTFFALVSAVTPYVTVYFSAKLLQELSLDRRPDVLLGWAMAAVLCTGVFILLKAFLNQRFETYYEDLYGRKEVLFSHKMFHLDYADIDNQEIQGLRSKIRQNENWSSWGLMRTPEHYRQGLTSLFGMLSGITLTVSLFTSPVPETSGWLTILNHPVFILVLISCILLVSLLAGHLAGKAVAIWSNMAENATFSNRLFSYFGEFAEKGNRSEDVRLYNQQDLVQYYTKALSDINFGVSGPMAKLARSSMGVYSATGTALTALLTGGIYVFTCLKAWGGAFDVGSITQYVGAVTALAANIFSLVQLIGQLKANAPYLEQTFTFLNLPNSMYQGSLTTEKRADRQYEVEFQDVSFRYPGASNWSLRHVSLKFTIGSRLAIVGENGSGKTTFIKLLCRLYDPQEGHILLNGIDIRKYKYDDYMDIFSVVFQDFQLLAQPLGANVAGTGTYDKKRVEKALLDAGFKERLASMPKGLDTPLYKDFAENGVEVSGGEAQKIAIARALYKDAPFIILDEPTAALDPVAEAEIYARFNEISGDRTAIYISHRLSSCKFCDEIVVFHDGQIVEKGTHEELLALEHGKYAQLWNAQAQYYTET